MYMRTKRIIAKCEQHSGYGAGAGDTEYYEYECPCGKGTIIEEHDNILGFREHSVYLHCTTCSKEYIIDTSAGTRNWKIVRKKVNRMKTQPYISAFTASERYPDEIDNYNKLLETARSHDTQLTIKFLTRLGIPENQVVLTTRHSSKGLEFDVVILPGMEKDSFPSYYDNTPRKLAEARRLCFVSVSRARKACILIRSKNLQNQYGRWFSKEPSPFWVALQEFQDSRSDY